MVAEQHVHTQSILTLAACPEQHVFPFMTTLKVTNRPITLVLAPNITDHCSQKTNNNITDHCSQGIGAQVQASNITALEHKALFTKDHSLSSHSHYFFSLDVFFVGVFLIFFPSTFTFLCGVNFLGGGGSTARSLSTTIGGEFSTSATS